MSIISPRSAPLIALLIAAIVLCACGGARDGDETLDADTSRGVEVLPSSSMRFPLGDDSIAPGETGSQSGGGDSVLPVVEEPATVAQDEPSSARCDPNYEPCVPIASDVDCAGGRGNGPAYVDGPVRVIGRDVYRLDADGDGIGCEN